MRALGKTAALVALLLCTCADEGEGPDARGQDGPAAADLADGPDRGLPDGMDRDKGREMKPADLPPTPDKAGDGALAPDMVGPVKGPLRVATFNCYCLKEDASNNIGSSSLRVKGVAAEIKALNLDAVGLQEVCQTVGSGGSDNFASSLSAELKTLTGQDWEYKFAKTHVSWSTYDEGVGLLARKGQIVGSGEQSLPQGNGPFPRKVVWAKVATSRGAFYLYSTHLTISSDANDRTNQVKSILTLVNQHLAAGLPQVVVGDFNDWYASAAVSAMKAGPPAFTESWGTKNPGSTTPGLTCCRPSFASRIDYVFVRTAALKSLDKVELAFDKTYSGKYLSDHLGVFVELTQL